MNKFARFVIIALILVVISSAGLPAQADSPVPLQAARKLQAVDHYAGPEEFGAAPEAKAAGDFKPAAGIEAVSIPDSLYVFQSYRDNNWEIYFSTGDYNNQTRLTDVGAADIHPQLNKGGTQIVFSSKRRGSYQLYRMNVDGSGLVQLTSTDTDNVYPAWSPDGTQIVFQSYRDGQAEIYRMDADGANQVRLTAETAYDGEPAWSPDGSKIAFASYRMGMGGIWVMNADGSGVSLVTLQQYASEPVWSPDGSQIALSADLYGTGWLSMLIIGSNGVRSIAPNITRVVSGDSCDYWASAWSPDGRYLLFTEIGYIQYQGNLYWTDAMARVYDLGTAGVYIQFSDMTLWNPHIALTDTQPPQVSLDPLPPESPAGFVVRWAGEDSGTAGLQNFDVQVKDDQVGAWVDWRLGIGHTSSEYQGLGGHTYAFRVRGRDLYGNLSGWVENPQTVTRVESKLPAASLDIPANISAGAVIRWQAVDFGGSGILSYDVQYRVKSSLAWVDWLAGVQQTGARFSAPLVESYYFRVRATDKAKNVGAWAESPNPARVCGLALQGVALNNRGQAVSSAVVGLSGSAVDQAASGLDGRFSLCTTAPGGSAAVTWAKTGYASLPETLYASGETVRTTVVLPPGNNAAANGDFETGDLNGWVSSGKIPAVISASQFASGRYSAQLGRASSGLSPVQTLSTINIPPVQISFARTSDGTVHLAYGEYDYRDRTTRLYVQSRPLNGGWLPREMILPSSYITDRIKLVVDDHDTIYAWYTLDAGSCCNIYLQKRTAGGIWGASQIISNGRGGFNLIAAPNGDVHFFKVYTTPMGDAYTTHTFQRANQPYWFYPYPVNLFGYTVETANKDGVINLLNYGMDPPNQVDMITFERRERNSLWTAPQQVFTSSRLNPRFTAMQMVEAPDGVVHAVSHTDPNTLYAFRSLDGNWSPVETFPGEQNKGNLLVSPTSRLYLITQDVLHGYPLLIREKPAGGGWSEPVEIFRYDSVHAYLEEMYAGLDAKGQIHVVFFTRGSSSATVYYTRRTAEGIWLPAQALSSSTTMWMPAMTVDENGQAHIAWWQGNNQYQGDIMYAGPDDAANDDASILQKTVQIPADMPAPALSFLYNLQTAAPGPVRFSVEAAGPLKTTQVLSTTASTDGWTHAWVDLSAYAGQTVTLTFALRQTAGQPAAWGFVDDISIGTSEADVWVKSAPLAGLPGSQVMYALAYGNQGGLPASGVLISHTLPAGMTFVAASLPVSAATPPTAADQTLTWDLGTLPVNASGTVYITATLAVRLKPGSTLTGSLEISTLAADLEPANNTAVTRMFIGRRVFLPVVLRK